MLIGNTFFLQVTRAVYLPSNPPAIPTQHDHPHWSGIAWILRGSSAVRAFPAAVRSHFTVKKNEKCRSGSYLKHLI